jgi:outer membrane protein TolC
MYIPANRRRARCAVGIACFVVAALLGSTASAQTDARDGPPLALDRVVELAADRQPMLRALDADALAARASAVADRQLPDPQLFGGVRGLPVDGDDAYSFTRDSDTQLIAGVMQEFPLASKRRLRGRRGEQEASRLEATRQLATRTIGRDAALAWLSVWMADRASELLAESLRDADAQAEAVAIAVKTDRAPQSALFAARVEVEMLRDRIAENDQTAARARNGLSRWIGDAARQPVAPELPAWPLPPLSAVLANLSRHPRLAALDLRAAEAQTGADLAKADDRPDWRVELGYGNRSRYSDMVMLQVGVDLPIFTAQRQDRRYAAALAQRESAQASRDDALRELTAETRADYEDLQRLNQRIDAHDARILPPAHARVEAALAAWRSGSGTLAQVLDARRAVLDLHLSRLQLQEQAAVQVVRLRYLGAYDAPSNSVESSP